MRALLRPVSWLAAAGGLLAGEAPAPADPLSSETLMAHVRFLSDDGLKGREAGTPEGRRAADYVAAGFREAGLASPPGCDDGAFLQRLEIPAGATLGPANRLVLGGEDAAARAEPGKGFLPMEGSAAKGRAEGKLVFAGYGITASEHGYDDYAGIDAKGKIVLVLRHEPREKDPKSPFDGERMSQHATFRSKLENAARRGASGLVLVDDPLHHPEDEAPRDPPGYVAAKGIPAVHARRGALAPALERAGIDLAKLQGEIDAAMAPRSRETDLPAAIEVDVRTESRAAHNVVGILEGSDPALRREAVVVGAHYDHVGTGHFGSLGGKEAKGEIHNGADDNASGTAAILGLARHFAALPPAERPKRTLVLIAFTGEEKGLLGSAHYVAHPLWPLADTAAMINLDMIGRSAGRLIVGGVGSGSGFREIVERAAQGEGLDLKMADTGYAPSDNMSFYERRIPVLFFFTGMHADYHRPGDDVEKVDAANLARIARIVGRTAAQLAGAAGRPVFAETRPEMMPGMVPDGPRLGITAEEGREGERPGCRVTGVGKGSAAERGGIVAGDLILEVAGKPAADPAGLRALLGECPYDKPVPVKIVREGALRTLEVVFRKS